MYRMSVSYTHLDVYKRQGLARLNQILQMAALTAGEPAQQVRNEDRIPIITIHQAKGSEFDHVFLAGLNDCLLYTSRCV